MGLRRLLMLEVELLVVVVVVVVRGERKMKNGVMRLSSV